MESTGQTLKAVNDEYLSVSVLFGDRAPAVKPTVIYEEGDKIPIGNGGNFSKSSTPRDTQKGASASMSPSQKASFRETPSFREVVSEGWTLKAQNLKKCLVP